MIDKRYLKNMNMLNQEELGKLQSSNVCLIGCGGLGGYIIEMLGRLAIGSITVVDGDVFDESNLNRQLLATEVNLGKNKALGAFERMQIVNSTVDVRALEFNLTKNNYKDVLPGHQLVIDALDNIETRLLLESFCEELQVPLVHGAIGGWYGQVSTIMPGDRTLSAIYSNYDEGGEEPDLGNPSFTPALVASIEVAEVVKVLLGRGNILSKKLLSIDLLMQDYSVLDI